MIIAFTWFTLGYLVCMGYTQYTLTLEDDDDEEKETSTSME